MTRPLPKDAWALLDFLCTAKATGRFRVKSLRAPALRLCEKLQDAGFVKWHSYEPTAWALGEWEKRNHLEDAIQPEAEHAPVERAAAAEVPNELPPSTPYFRCGHPRTPENTVKNKNRCRTCQQKFARESRARFRAAERAKRPSPPPPPPPNLCPGCNTNTAIAGTVCASCRIVFDNTGRLARAFRDRPNPRAKRYDKRGPDHGLRMPLAQTSAAETNHLSSTSGPELATALEAWCAKTGGSQTRLGLLLFHSTRGLAQLRQSKRVTKKTEDKVAAFLAAPCAPDDLPLRIAYTRRQSPAPTTAVSDERKEQLRQIKASNQRKETTRARARKLLDAGHTPSMKVNRDVRGAMNEITRADEQQFRATDPVEQAKTLIRSRGHRCFDASVYDGERKGAGFYYINRNRVDQAELLAYAERLRSICR